MVIPYYVLYCRGKLAVEDKPSELSSSVEREDFSPPISKVGPLSPSTSQQRWPYLASTRLTEVGLKAPLFQQQCVPEFFEVFISHKTNSRCDGTFDTIHAVAFVKTFSKAFFLNNYFQCASDAAVSAALNAHLSRCLHPSPDNIQGISWGLTNETRTTSRDQFLNMSWVALLALYL